MSAWLIGIALAAAAGPALLMLVNLARYRPPAPVTGDVPPVSVLIPARDEAPAIEAAVRSVLASAGVRLELLVGDDGSTDATPQILQRLAAEDARLRVLEIPPLPDGWCGKQHACHVLAQAASHEVLIWMDADVRLAPDALARLSADVTSREVDLISGFPHQQTGTLAERLVIPLMHFLLLGFLPLERMRRSTHPAYGAGCGQLFVARRSAYRAAGGHAAIRASLHDGLTLPRAFRAAGQRSDLVDLTPLAACRMYRGFGALWRGLAKNATEGLAAPRTILGATVVLLAGQVLPVVLLAWALTRGVRGPWLAAVVLAAMLAWLPRALAALRFGQSWIGVLGHPVGVLILLAIQWWALLARVTGRPSAWKGRGYHAPGAVATPHSCIPGETR